MCKLCVRILFLCLLMLFINQGVLFAAEDEAGNVVVLQPEKDIVEGSKIR